MKLTQTSHHDEICCTNSSNQPINCQSPDNIMAILDVDLNHLKLILNLTFGLGLLSNDVLMGTNEHFKYSFRNFGVLGYLK